MADFDADTKTGGLSGAQAEPEQGKGKGPGTLGGGPADYPCSNCGALQAYKPGSEHLQCKYCGHLNHINHGARQVVENDLTEQLNRAVEDSVEGALDAVKCDSCAAEFSLESHKTADECPFCGSAIVVDPVEIRQIAPDGVLPFRLERAEAIEAAKKWIRGSWLAPEKVRRWVSADEHFHGVYLPHWTFDAQTNSRFQGMRGDTYMVTVGSGENRRTEMRIRWTPVSGRTNRFFDDVVVPASHSLPAKHLHRLQPWDLDAVVPYTSDYLAGFQAEAYQVALPEGFAEGKRIMTAQIENDVRRKIGGDRQRIHRLETTYSETTFKHLLLPAWLSAFRWNNKVYRFVVNARTGQVRGEKPVSVIKVAILVILGLLLAIGLGAFLYSQGFFD